MTMSDFPIQSSHLRRTIRCLLLWTCLWIPGGTGWAQAPDPPAPPPGRMAAENEEEMEPPPEPSRLKTLRAEFSRRMKEAGRKHRENYAESLLTVENEAASIADWESALRAQTRRAELLKQIDSGEPEEFIPPSETEGTVILEATDAAVEGSLSRSDGLIHGWGAKGSVARWEVRNLEPGTYEVLVGYRSYHNRRGLDEFDDLPPWSIELQFGEDSSFAAGGTLEVRLRGQKEYREVPIGRMTTSRPSMRVFLAVTAVSKRAEMAVKCVYLRPLAPDGPEESTDPVTVATEPQRLIDLRGFHERYLRDLGNPALTSYLEALAQFEAAQPEDSPVRAVTRRESDQAKESMENRPMEIGFHKPQSGGGIDPQGESQRLEGVTYVEDPANTGSAFKVSVAGQELNLRLYYGDAPPVDGSDREALAAAADYFGGTSGEILETGKSARDFTAGLLTGRSFRVTVWGQKDDEGRTYAMVLIPGIGSLQKALVTRGLVSLTGLTLDPGMLSGEEYRDGVLKSLEEEAKAERRGAWSLR